MKKFFVLFCLAAFARPAAAESVYTCDFTTDGIIGSVSFWLATSSLFFSGASGGASLDAVPSKDSVNAFDRGLVFSYNKPLSVTSDIAAYGIVLFPLLSLAGNAKDIRAWASYGIMFAESVLLVLGTTEFMKNAAARYRPYVYFGYVPPGKEDDFFKSFPSRHTAFAFMSAGFLTSTFCAEYPDSFWKLPLGAAAYTLAAGIGAGRVFSGNHFLSDALAGAAIGSLFGYLVPWLHLRKERARIELLPQPRGFAVRCRF